MKNKFERLSKEDRKKAVEEFKNVDDRNHNLVNRLKRLKIIGVVGIVYSVLVFFMDFLNEQEIVNVGINIFGTQTIVNYIIDACLLVFCVFFLVKSNQILKEQVNKYLIEKDKVKSKK